MTVLSTLLVLAASDLSIAAQNHLVLPADASTRDGNDLSPFPFFSGGFAFQQQWRASLFGARPRLLTGLAFREDVISSRPGSIRVRGLRLELGHAALGIEKMATHFARNRGVGMQVVLQQDLDLPPPRRGRRGLAFDVPLVFDRAFVHDPQRGDLLLEMRSSSAPPQSGDMVLMDAHDAHTYGERASVGDPGRFHSGPRLELNVLTPDSELLPGGTIHYQVAGLTRPFVGVLALGRPTYRWGNLPLPLDLTRFGNAGAWWHVRADLIRVPARTRVGNLHEGNHVERIPDDPGLVGGWLDAQAIYFDPQANPMGAVVSNAMKVKIGSGAGDMQAIANESPVAVFGMPLFGPDRGGPVVRFTFR